MGARWPGVGPLLRRYWRALGPGVITGAADDDPASIGTYAQTGALFGYTQLWLALLTIPMMVVLQEMCARIALHTGMGLTEVLQRHFSRVVVWGAVLLLVVTNLITIGADLSAMAAAGGLLFPIPYALWLVILAVVLGVLQLTIRYRKYARVLRILTISLLAYVIVVFIVPQPWGVALLHTVLPTLRFSFDFLLNIVALLGSVASPYMFFWQSSQEVEERIRRNGSDDLASTSTTRAHEMGWMRSDIVTGMIFSNLITWFIIMTTASTLYRHGVHDIDSAVQAAQALVPLAGPFAGHIFALGIIGTGLLAIPVMCGSTAYALTTLLHVPQGFSHSLRGAPLFYSILVLSVLAGLLLGLLGVNPLKALYYSAILDGLVAPPLLILLLRIAGNRRIMDGHVNGWVATVWGWCTVAIVTAASLLLLYSVIFRVG